MAGYWSLVILILVGVFFSLQKAKLHCIFVLIYLIFMTVVDCTANLLGKEMHRPVEVGRVVTDIREPR